MSKQYLSIACSNGNSGVFGFSQGTPQLRFDVADRGVLQGQELRFQGTLKVVQNADNETPPVLATDVNFDAYTGAQGVIQTLEISSRAYSSRALETIQNYPRLCASLYSALHSKSQYSSQLFHEQMTKGRGFDSDAERNDTNSQVSISNVGQTKSQRKPTMYKDGVSFDMRLTCGMFMSQDIDLEMLGGLTIEMTLAPDSNVLSGANASDYHYIIENPRIIVPIMDKSPQAQMDLANSPSSTMSFLSYTSLYNTITSTDNQIVHRTNLRGVVSSFQNYVPVKFINNYANNGLGQYNPAIKQLTFHKGASRFPLEYSILVQNDPTKAPATQKTLYPQVLVNYLSAFRNWRDIKKSCVNSYMSNMEQTNRSGGAVSGIGCWGTGCSYDSVSGAGVSANNDTLGFEIQSSLSDPSDADSTAQTPYAVYTYYLCRNQVRVNAGVGIEVVS